MFQFPITYEEPVFRPPGEAQSLLLQATIGCSHNRCSFCAMYRSKKYRVRSLTEIENDLERAAAYFNRRKLKVRKLFLCDGDALAAPTHLLSAVSERARSLFPGLRRTAVYATAANVLRKTNDELLQLREAGVSLAYLGLESGSNEVLRLIGKGNTAEQASEAIIRLSESGWQTSLIVMLGLGGRQHAAAHRAATVEIINTAPPRFLSFLTTTAVPGTAYYQQLQEGKIEELTCLELLEEMHFLIEHLVPGRPIVFRANHVSNLFPLEGVLPKDRDALLSALKKWITECPREVYPNNDPFFL